MQDILEKILRKYRTFKVFDRIFVGLIVLLILTGLFNHFRS